MIIKMFERINAYLARHVSEKRIYMRTEQTTQYFCVTPLAQLTVSFVVIIGTCWTIIATSALLIDQISASSDTKQAEVLQRAYEARLNELSQERDRRALETQTAQDRFYVALEQISLQQNELLQAEEERRELATGLTVIQKKLQTVINERNEAQKQTETILAEMQAATGRMSTKIGGAKDTQETLEQITKILNQTVMQRDKLEKKTNNLFGKMAEMSREHLFQQQQNAWIFSNLEQAVNVTLGPLERALGNAGMNVDSLIKEMRKVNSGQGGPISALSKATNGDPETTLSSGTLELFERLDRVGLAKLAVEKLPLAFPVRGGFRHTSGFGYRYDPKTGSRRWHNGHDLAGARGTAIVATGDGVVTFAGRQGGYGKLVKIRHIRGFQTYYAHLNRIRVKLGQRVSRGEKIGDMGNTGRSTGVHLHYEVRINGNAVNPSKYMKAAPNVF